MNKKYPHFAIPEIYGESLSYYELLRKLVQAMNVVIENYDTIPNQIAEAVANLDASQLFSAVLNQIIDSIATDNTKSTNAVKVYKKHDLLYATFNDTVKLYESLVDFTTGTETELIIGTNIREVNISELFIEIRNLIEGEAQAREQADNTKVNKTDILTLEQIKETEDLTEKVASAGALKNVNSFFGNLKLVYQSNVTVNFNNSSSSAVLTPPENAVLILSVNSFSGGVWTYTCFNHEFRVRNIDDIKYNTQFTMDIVWACLNN